MTTAKMVAPEVDQMLKFTLGTERYCVGIDEIDEIVRPNDITELPETPSAIAGVMDLRGETTTIVDPGAVFDIATSDDGKQVVIFDGDDTQFGWLVDRVHEVREIPDLELDPVADNQYVNGLVSDGEEFTIWVDAETIHDSLSV
jgi:purine-binding chemotaxis protein CheW